MKRHMMRMAATIALSVVVLGMGSMPLLAGDEYEILRECCRIQEAGRDSLASLYEIQPSAR